MTFQKYADGLPQSVISAMAADWEDFERDGTLGEETELRKHSEHYIEEHLTNSAGQIIIVAQSLMFCVYRRLAGNIHIGYLDV